MNLSLKFGLHDYIVEFYQTFRSISMTRLKNGKRVVILLGNTARKKWKQLVHSDHQNANSLCSLHHYVKLVVFDRVLEKKIFNQSARVFSLPHSLKRNTSMSLPVKILLLVQIPVVYVRIWGAVIEEFYLKIMGGFFYITPLVGKGVGVMNYWWESVLAFHSFDSLSSND